MLKHHAAVALLAIPLLAAGPASALEATTRSYIIQPVPAPDVRNSYVPPQGAIYVIDNLRGTITMCYPDSLDSKFAVTCTPQTSLPH